MKIEKETVKKIMSLKTREEQGEEIRKIAGFPEDEDCGYFTSEYPYTDSLIVSSHVNFEYRTICLVLEKVNVKEWYVEEGEIFFNKHSFNVLITSSGDKTTRVFLISPTIPVVVEGSIDVPIGIVYKELFNRVEKAVEDGTFFEDFSEENLEKIIQHYESEEERVNGKSEPLEKSTVDFLKSIFEIARSGSSMNEEIDKFIEKQQKRVILSHEQ